jgi:hypothetical protein
MQEHMKTVQDDTLALLHKLEDAADVRAAEKPWFVLIAKGKSWVEKGSLSRRNLNLVSFL